MKKILYNSSMLKEDRFEYYKLAVFEFSEYMKIPSKKSEPDSGGGFLCSQSHFLHSRHWGENFSSDVVHTVSQNLLKHLRKKGIRDLKNRFALEDYLQCMLKHWLKTRKEILKEGT